MIDVGKAGHRPVNLDALTGVRFFAAVAIVILHTSYSLGYGGELSSNFALWSGVSFFFVLSGFVLFYVYRDLESGRGGARFLWLRVSRIWPLQITSLCLIYLLPEGLKWSNLRTFGVTLLGMAGVALLLCALAYGLGRVLRRRNPAQESGALRFLRENLLLTVLLVLLVYCLAQALRAGVARVFLCHVFLISSWMPGTLFGVGLFNPPDWSLSNELFFYLAFPLLVWGWRATARVKLVLAMLVAGLLMLAEPHVPAAFFQWIGGSREDFVSKVPLVRVLEFISGMAAANLWLRWGGVLGCLGAGWATVLEAMAFALLLTAAHYLRVDPLRFSNPFRFWLSQCLGILPFTVLLFLLASQRGILSRLLATRPLVLLGEISFATYMMHHLLILTLLNHNQMAGEITLPLARLAVFWAVLLTVSWLSWRYLEIPCRQRLAALVGSGAGHTTSSPAATPTAAN